MEGKSNGIDTDWARLPPPQGPLLERIGKAFYNPADHSFLGRTPKRWGIVLAFYLVFYAALAVMFAICMAGMYASLEKHRPTFTLKDSLIGANPGVAHRPRSVNVNSFTVHYNTNDTSLYEAQMKHFLQGHSGKQTVCAEADNYGFPLKPCFYIKLNKIYDWAPEYMTDAPDMPKTLQDHIQSLKAEERKQVWISCEEEQGNQTGIEYPWGVGLSGDKYPFRSDPGYVSPLVAIQLTPPVNQEVIIRCRAWAKNIIYNKSIKEPSGYTRIILHVQSNQDSDPDESTTDTAATELLVTR